MIIPCSGRGTGDSPGYFPHLEEEHHGANKVVQDLPGLGGGPDNGTANRLLTYVL